MLHWEDRARNAVSKVQAIKLQPTLLQILHFLSSIRRATCLAALARAYRVDQTYATIVQRCNGYHKSECLSVFWQHSASQALCSSV